MHLIRPINLGLIVLIQILCFMVFCGDSSIASFSLGILFPTLFTAVAGYIINNYFDLKKDKANGKPILKLFNNKAWLGLYLGLNAVALLLCFWQQNGLLPWVLGIQSMLLVYAYALSNWLLIGNVVVSIMAVSVVAILYLSNAVFCNLGQLWVLLISIFLVTMTREIVKDIEDMEGDKQFGSQTMPVVFGVKAALIIANVFLLCNIFFIFSWGYYAFWTVSMPATVLIGFITFFGLFIWIYALVNRSENKWRNISLLLKLYMLLGLMLTPFLNA